jgi:hypothetical protein
MVLYRMRNCFARILSQINPLRALPSHFFEKYVNFILPVSAWIFQVALFFVFAASIRILHRTVARAVPSAASRFDCTKRIWWGIQIKKLLIIQIS